MVGLWTDPATWLALVTLTALEVVLGIDNLVMLSILVTRLPASSRRRARLCGLAMAMAMRVALLFCVTWLATLNQVLFVLVIPVTGRVLALVGGGLFLLGKSVIEMHAAVEQHDPSRPSAPAAGRARSFLRVVTQIALLDIVFSLDSVFTAVGFAQHIEVMIAAIVLAMAFMMLVAAQIGAFIERHPTVKILALSFLLLIGVTLIADAFHQHIPKSYLYFAMAFAIVVEMLNLRIRASGSTEKS